MWRDKHHKKPALLLVNVNFDIVRTLEARLQEGFGERCWTMYSRPVDDEHPRMFIDGAAFFDAVVIDLKGIVGDHDSGMLEYEPKLPDWIENHFVSRERARAVTLLAPEAVYQPVQYLATSLRRDCVVTVRDTRSWKKAAFDPVSPLVAKIRARPASPRFNIPAIDAAVRAMEGFFHP